MARPGFLHIRQLRAHVRAVNADASVVRVLIVALLGLHVGRLHLRLARPGEVDLKGRADEVALIAQELEKFMVVLRPTTYQVHGLAVCATELDLLAAVEEARPVLFRNELVELGNELFAILFNRFCDVDEERLVGRARESTEEVEEVVSASRA